MRLTPIGISILLLLGAANAFAEHREYRRDGMNAVRAYQMQGSAYERSEQNRAQQAEQEIDRRHNGGFGVPDSSGYSTQGESAHDPSDNMRRHGRLSPEERRALRRQIDEAGQDIYRQKR